MKIANIFHSCYFLIGKFIAAMKRKTTFEFAKLKPNERMRELVLYIVEKHKGAASFGKTKLIKILFFADFYFFKATGEPVTGASYRKGEFGPIPADMNALLEQMESDGELEQKRFKFVRTKRSVFTAKRQANLSSFTREQIALVDGIIDELALMKSSDASDMSHTRLWEIARLGELIPYEAILISDAPITDYEIGRTKNLCSQYGWEN